ncbi:peptide-methionine (S)-S-oxide reductase MsrA [Flavobacterium sp. '19STA2R22 D10 B1']|uniref:peptide-methionine (S)-S-oxide reductase MsrA n=1 Tax=Flavobacterium aerium TaxID=3037261 RepID=UPI00278BC01F|nr:peptide-methionine (S)-S-oxide reductase MsrA [Flavobacterium sp. '19STA2R22 D10 B1']
MRKIIGLSLIMLTFSCQSKEKESKEMVENQSETVSSNAKDYEVATFAGGCFWCTEAVFLQLEGVQKVVSGYTGGTIKNPSYKEISTGSTGHAEAIEITFDPKVIKYTDLLDIFFATHDPTSLNRQGADVGTQYRSEIFYHSAKQKEEAEAAIKSMDDQNIFGKKIVTKLSPAVAFYKAEDYHQNYYSQNSNQPYCQMVISPKLEKLKKKFQTKLKK